MLSRDASPELPTARSRTTPGRIRTLASAGVAALLTVVAACSDPAPAKPNVVLLVLDTVRADHVGSYGYERPTTPRLDAFAVRATRYSDSVSSSPWTLPSHASMFTGKPPFAHGAHTFEVSKPQKNVNPLSAENLTLAEVLRTEGYRTGAIVANDGYLARHWRLDQGFETYHVERLYADRLNERVFDWLERSDGRPFFLFVNYMDAHRPYNTRPRPGFIDPPASQAGSGPLKELIRRVLPGTDPVPEDLVRTVIDQYDTGIANLDEQLGVLFDRLEAAGRFDDTVVVVTSDHGEYFGEHHLVEHSKDVYQPALLVPLIVRAPGQVEGRVDPSPVVSNDLPRLIFDRFPEPSSERLRSLFPERASDEPRLAENYYTRGQDLFHPLWGARFRRVRRALFDGPYKWIDSSDGADELYRLDNDPAEERNLLAEHPEVAARLAGVLEKQLADAPEFDRDETPLDDETVERLEALGYLGND